MEPIEKVFAIKMGGFTFLKSKKSYFSYVNFATLARFLLNNHNGIEK